MSERPDQRSGDVGGQRRGEVERQPIGRRGRERLSWKLPPVQYVHHNRQQRNGEQAKWVPERQRDHHAGEGEEDPSEYGVSLLCVVSFWLGHPTSHGTSGRTMRPSLLANDR
jgi:hypothetical protein